MYDEFRLAETDVAMQDWDEIISIELHGDNLPKLYNDCNDSLLNVDELPDNRFLETLLRKQLKRSEQFKQTYALYEQDIAQGRGSRDYETLRGLWQRYLENNRLQRNADGTAKGRRDHSLHPAKVKVKVRKVKQILLVVRGLETASNGARKASAAEAMIAPGLKATPLRTKTKIKETNENKAEAVQKEKGDPKGNGAKPQRAKQGAPQMREKKGRLQRKALFEVSLPVVKRIVLLVFPFSEENALKERIAMTCILQNAGITATHLCTASALEERTVTFCMIQSAKRLTRLSYRLLMHRRQSSPSCCLDSVLMAFQ